MKRDKNRFTGDSDLWVFIPKDEVNLSSKVSLKMIDGKKAYKTKEEAEKVAKEMGCNGYHKHKVDDVVYYMPCKSHDKTKKNN